MLNQYIYNPSYANKRSSEPELDLGRGDYIPIVIGSKHFFDVLEKGLNLSEKEEIIGIDMNEAAINVRLKKN